MSKNSSARAERFIKLKSKEYREAYARALIEQGLAYQIRSMRTARGWSQAELAERLQVKSQSVVSRLEDPSYGKHSLQTLERLSGVFDVGLSVRFVSFGRLLSENEDLSPFALNAVSFADECDTIISSEVNFSLVTDDIIRTITVNVDNGSGYLRIKHDDLRQEEFSADEDEYVD